MPQKIIQQQVNGLTKAAELYARAILALESSYGDYSVLMQPGDVAHPKLHTGEVVVDHTHRFRVTIEEL